MMRRVITVLAPLLAAAAPVGAADHQLLGKLVPIRHTGADGIRDQWRDDEWLGSDGMLHGHARLSDRGLGNHRGEFGRRDGYRWALSQDLDTFNVNWNFDLTDSLGQLVSLLLDGRLALTLFDRTDPSFGTDGSFRGTDFDSSLPDTTLIDVTYLNPTGIGGADPVGDIFQQVFIDFGLTGPRSGDFTFLQDTDNDSRFGCQDSRTDNVDAPRTRHARVDACPATPLNLPSKAPSGALFFTQVSHVRVRIFARCFRVVCCGA